jgi:adenylylsulfate kinase-like enzyme
VIVVVTGPIASGKTTLVHALARELRSGGRTAATLDRDDVYALLGESGVGDEASWGRANRLCVAFAHALLAEGVDVVVVESDDPVDGAFHVTLTAPIEAALERVQLDPTRIVSRDPGFLRAHYESYAPLEADLRIDTSRSTLEETVRIVTRELRSPSAN